MESIKDYVSKKKSYLRDYIDSHNINQKIVIIQVGNVEASNRYVKNKLKDCKEVHLQAELKHYNSTITEEELIMEITNLNQDKSVLGFIVQLPLPKHINSNTIINAIFTLKDLDGFSFLNSYCYPATPAGIVNYLKEQDYEFQSKNAVIIGRSNIVGKPMHKLLLNENMNVTILHTKTLEEDKKFYLEHADLIIVATGHRHTLTSTYKLKQSAIIFDVGINFDENGKLCGDCDYNDLVDKVYYISKVPGGCGLLTRLQLLLNAMILYKIQRGES